MKRRQMSVTAAIIRFLLRDRLLQRRRWLIICAVMCAMGLRAGRIAADEPMTALSLQQEFVLEPLTSYDLFGVPSARAQPVHSLQHLPISFRPVSRDIPALWQIRIPADVYPGSLVVQYRLTGANGKVNQFSHPDQPESVIHVAVSPLPPRVVATEIIEIEVEFEDETSSDVDDTLADEEEETENSDHTSAHSTSDERKTSIQKKKILVIEGGVTLRFNARSLKYAGPHIGTLTVIVNRI